MVITLSLSSVGCGELGRVLEICYESCSCKLLVYVLWMSLRLHGLISLRFCEWIGYNLTLSLVVRASWYICGRYCS